MSGIQLLDKTRKIGKLLHNSHSTVGDFIRYCITAIPAKLFLTISAR